MNDNQNQQNPSPVVGAQRPFEIRLPARPGPVARATPKDQKDGEADRSVDLFTGEMLDEHGRQCAATIERVMTSEVMRIKAVADVFAQKLKSLGHEPNEVIAQAVAARKAAAN